MAEPELDLTKRRRASDTIDPYLAPLNIAILGPKGSGSVKFVRGHFLL
jgi:hypothetical protein